MDASDEPERIEVELVPTESPRRRSRRTAPPAPPPSAPPPSAPADLQVPDRSATGEVPASPSPVAPGFLGTDRRRLLVTAVGVGVIGVLLGWMLGRTGGAERSDPAVDVATTTVPRVPSLGPFASVGTLPDPDVEPRPTVSRPPATTTTLPPRSVERVAVDRRLADVPLRLVGGSSTGRVLELDLAAGTLTTWHLQGAGYADSGLVFAGDDWIAYPDVGSGRLRLVYDDDSTLLADLGDPWQVLRIGDTDRFWRFPSPSRWGEPMVLTEVTVDGEPTGNEVTVPPTTWPWVADPAGGVVVQAAGRVYQVSPGGATPIGTGDLVALSAEAAVLRTCDDRIRCGLVVVDRATGTQRPLPPDPALGESAMFESPFSWGPGAGAAMSPDGRFAAVLVPGERTLAFGLVDLVTGEFTELTSVFQHPNVVWSPDGRFAISVTPAGLQAYDTIEDETFPVYAGAAGWRALTARPVAADAPSGATGAPTGSAAEETVEG